MESSGRAGVGVGPGREREVDGFRHLVRKKSDGHDIGCAAALSARTSARLRLFSHVGDQRLARVGFNRVVAGVRNRDIDGAVLAGGILRPPAQSTGGLRVDLRAVLGSDGRADASANSVADAAALGSPDCLADESRERRTNPKTNASALRRAVTAAFAGAVRGTDDGEPNIDAITAVSTAHGL